MQAGVGINIEILQLRGNKNYFTVTLRFFYKLSSLCPFLEALSTGQNQVATHIQPQQMFCPWLEESAGDLQNGP